MKELERLDLWGCICKADSPSSGMVRVTVYGAAGALSRAGAGMFTKAFMEHFPMVPVEEEGRLQDPAVREMFFERLFTLRRPATPARCTDVLLHVMGYFRPFLSAGEKRELLEAVRRYRDRLAPLIVPVTLAGHYARKHDVAWLKRQVFLNPHPVEMMLRNHV